MFPASDMLSYCAGIHCQVLLALMVSLDMLRSPLILGTSSLHRVDKSLPLIEFKYNPSALLVPHDISRITTIDERTTMII